MSFSWSRILKSVYRKHPVVSVMVTAGAMDAIMGGFGDRPSLLAFGLGTVGVAFALRWWQSQQVPPPPTDVVPQYYLPSGSSRPQLPMLTVTKKRPPRGMDR